MSYVGTPVITPPPVITLPPVITPPPTPPPESTGKPSNNGLSAGIVAAIVIGVGVFVAAVTALSVFILMRRYSKPSYARRRSNVDTAEGQSQSSRLFSITPRKRRSGRQVKRDPSEKLQKQSAVSAEGSTVQYIDLDRDLPQPISEGSLRQEWENLSVSIKNHVTDCYHRDPVDKVYPVDKSSPLASLEPSKLANSRSRGVAIRQCIGNLIVQNIRPDGNPEHTFLPPKLVSIIHSMPIMASEKSPLLEAALAKWRVITNFLLVPRRGQNPEYMVNFDIIKEAAEKLSKDLQPYLQPKSTISEDECRESLEKTLRLGAAFGLKLFSQGARWSFGGWDTADKFNNDSRRHYMVVLPALLKMTDEDGLFLPDPIVLHQEMCAEF